MPEMKQPSEKITCPVCGKSDRVRKLSAAYQRERAKHPDSPHTYYMQPPENIREAT